MKRRLESQADYKRLSADVVEILNCIKRTISVDTDVVWTRYDSVADLINALDLYVKRVRDGDITVFDDLEFEFAPTASWQELATSNGWGNYFLDLADRFDKAKNRLRPFYRKRFGRKF